METSPNLDADMDVVDGTATRDPTTYSDNLDMDINHVESLFVTLLVAEKDDSEADFNFDALPDLAMLSPREEKLINDFVEKRQAIIRFIRDSSASAADRQKKYADSSSRSDHLKYTTEIVLLSTYQND